MKPSHAPRFNVLLKGTPCPAFEGSIEPDDHLVFQDLKSFMSSQLLVESNVKLSLPRGRKKNFSAPSAKKDVAGSTFVNKSQNFERRLLANVLPEGTSVPKTAKVEEASFVFSKHHHNLPQRAIL